MDYDGILDLDDLSPDLLDELPPEKIVATESDSSADTER